MTKHIITSGSKAADIDVFACAIVYEELLRLEGKDALAVIPGKLTSTVTPSILKLHPSYITQHVHQPGDVYVLVDISDPRHVPAFVDVQHVIEVYDHRKGHEDFWKQNAHVRARIDLIGSCGTLIWEEYKKRGKAADISTASAQLLLASIVSNTLNFQAGVTSERDIEAFRELSARIGLASDWIYNYYTEQENHFHSDFVNLVDADVKTFEMGDSSFAVGQIEMWNAETFWPRLDEIAGVMEKYNAAAWLVNMTDVREGVNYIFSRSEKGKVLIEKMFGVGFVNDVLKTPRMVMRKEIMAMIYELYKDLIFIKQAL